MKTVAAQKLFPFVIFVTVGLPLPSYGRWAVLQDAPVSSTKDDAIIEVEKDGTHRITHDSVVEIRNESGRSLFGLRKLGYNSRASQIKNVQAETLLNDQSYKVDKEFIEDKPLASSAEGFDEIRQVSVAYPKVEVGALLRLKYEKVVSEVPLEGAFSLMVHYGDEMPELASSTLVRSRLPLLVAVQDPLKVLTVIQEKEGDIFVVKLRLKSPIFRGLTEEEDAAVPKTARTWALISSHQSAADLAKLVSRTYEDRFQAPLPPAFKKIVSDASQKKSTVEQINLITSRLADEVRYLGDWRATRGGHIPRPLETIASTRFGDCKDLSLSTAAMLRQLGYDAHIAWIERNRVASDFPPLAYDGAFNHAIVFAKKGTESFWIDPTNIASYAQGTFEDIAGRPAVVIKPDGSELQRTPDLRAEATKVNKRMEYTFDKNGDATVDASATVSGLFAVPLTAATRQISKESVEHYIAKSLVDDSYITSRVFQPFDLSSRIVTPYTFKVKLAVRNMCLTTTAGLALPLRSPSLEKILDLETESREGDLILDSPHLSDHTNVIRGARVVGKSSLSCRVASRWIDATRDIKAVGKNVQIHTLLNSKTGRISVSDLKSPEFLAVQRKLQGCFGSTAVVFRRN